MKKKLATLLCCFLASCLGANKVENGYTKFSNMLTQKFIEEVCHDGKFQVVARGEGIKEIQINCLTFEVLLNVDISSARVLYLNLMEKYLTLLNDNLEIRPYLYQYPYGIEAFELTLSFIQPNGRFVNPPFIGAITRFEDKINYNIFDLEQKKFSRVFSEPYDEAYKIVYGKERGK